MKKYYEYPNLKTFCNSFAKSKGTNKATEIFIAEKEEIDFLYVSPGYRKKYTGEYVPKAYIRNFGWKNTYYQHAIFEVYVPWHIYLYFAEMVKI